MRFNMQQETGAEKEAKDFLSDRGVLQFDPNPIIIGLLSTIKQMRDEFKVRSLIMKKMGDTLIESAEKRLSGRDLKDLKAMDLSYLTELHLQARAWWQASEMTLREDEQTTTDS